MTTPWHQLSHSQLLEATAGLMPFAGLREYWDLSAEEIYWLIMLRALPAVLVDGEWRFEQRAIDAWAEDNGGLPAVRAFVRDALDEWRRAREELDGRGAHPALRGGLGPAE
ncbi:helix-turn-helix domain-containing protein [Streptomyces malaysiensis]|uniref:Helix-turn-helix domain-containing protein n=1 Tax=Streptomyces malaysiensis subsp. samsunensis TaxID=459658 RepID=A0A9X2LV24_STRMQ|nr:helix-turn-helix domain-containing protein [Streptomyces samsunensis]MCQ8830079.1 helix-turn-helix domain-containing protein [Streptomyces samsunensis]